MKKECKLMELGRIKSFETEKDLIQKYISDMDYFKEGEIVPFTALLANNIRDRQLDRIPKKSLKIFENTIVGKMRLLNHNSSERTGRFYDAKLVKKSKEEVLSLFANTNFPGLEKHLDEVESIDKGLYFLETKFYMLNKTANQQEYVSNVIGGIDAFMSISFTGFKAVPIYEENNGNQNVKYWELQAIEGYPAEALEGSAVFLGAQYTAQVTKEFLPIDLKSTWTELENIKSQSERELCQQLDNLIQKGMVSDISGKIPEFMESRENWTQKFIDTLPSDSFIQSYPIYNKEKLVYLPNFRKLIADYGNENVALNDNDKKQIMQILKKLGIEYSFKQTKGNKKMAEIILSVPSLNIAKVVDPEKGKEWQDEIETAVKTKLAETEKAVELQNKIEKVFGKDFDLSKIEKAKKDAEAYRESLVKDAVYYGKQAKAITETDESAKKAFFEKMEIEQVQEWIANYKSMITTKPNDRQVPGNPKTDNSGSFTEVDNKKAFVGGFQLTV